jgi:hypothetical protein
MEQNKLGAPAEAPTPVGTENRAETHSNYTPNAGAQQIARLIAGEQIFELSSIPEPWGSLAQKIAARRNGASAVDVFEELIVERADANELRAAVLAVKIHQDEPDREDETKFQELSLLAAAPELPKLAWLPENLVTGMASGLAGVGGWLSDYIAFACLASPMSPPLFHLILGLTLLSTAIARRVYVRVSNYNLYPNIYALIVAHSTLYAKTTAFEIARRVLQLADLARLMLPVGITPQSLIGELTNRQPDTFSTWELSDQDDWRSERKFAAQRVWLMDEAAGLLDAFDQKHLADLLNQVLKLFDCPDMLTAASTIARGRQTIRNAYLTICGPTTPSAMRIHLNNRSHWGNGLFARFAFVTPDVQPRRIFYPPEIEIPTSLIDPLRMMALERLPMPEETLPGEAQTAEALRAQLADNVWKSWDAYHAGLWELICKRAIPEKFYASYGRFHTLAMKIALQLATVDWAGSPGSETVIVTMQHWAKAQMITEELRASLHRMIADTSRVSEDDDLEAKAIRLLRQSPRGMSTRELAIALSMTDSGRRDQLDHLVERMRRDGLTELIERKGARGPAAQAWILISKT